MYNTAINFDKDLPHYGTSGGAIDLGGGVVRQEDTGVWFEVPDHGGLRCQLFAASASGEDGKPAAVPCQWTDPNMKVSTFALERENGEVRSLSFKVRPDFYDPLEYTYTR